MSQRPDASLPGPGPVSRAGASESRADGIVRWRIRALLRFTLREILRRRILTEAGAVAFFLLMAIPPGVTAFGSLYGLLAEPTTMRQHVSLLTAIVPSMAIGVVEDQLERLSHQQPSALGWSFAIALSLSLLSASAAMRALFDSLNTIFQTPERRSFLELVALTCVFTLAAEVFLLASVAFVVVLPIAVRMLGLDAYVPTALSLARWPLLFAIAAFGMSAALRFGPCGVVAKWRDTIFAGAIAAALWIAMSIGFDAVFRHLATVDAGQGSLGAILAFMTWLWLSASITLICARFVPAARHTHLH